MNAVDPARVSLLLSLVVLGCTIAAFATVAGITAGFTAESAGEFTVTNGALTHSTGDGAPTTIIDDVSDLERIVITNENGRVDITTEDRAEHTLSDDQRDVATQTIVTNETISGLLTEAETVELTTVPIIDENTVRDRAGLATIDPDADRLSHFTSSDEAAFESHRNESKNAVVLERNEPRTVETLALVIIEPVGENEEYRVVVDLETESIERILHIELVSERGQP